eukprot:CAMPEP_0176078132 /NCGR_PEP_ID=MMETSP0120_2-20121206/39072_1 /TAXON_ID=160619 /ORGANISM="Kryptoperidinium foliaceum, Strain CCMP 1326" /LENGTH=239 /DNA_ID=CAMNT_0017411877 /DNA_START=12 /DNA_END=732 /DNA_ORIENTATION=+
MARGMPLVAGRLQRLLTLALRLRSHTYSKPPGGNELRHAFTAMTPRAAAVEMARLYSRPDIAAAQPDDEKQPPQAASRLAPPRSEPTRYTAAMSPGHPGSPRVVPPYAMQRGTDAGSAETNFEARKREAVVAALDRLRVPKDPPRHAEADKGGHNLPPLPDVRGARGHFERLSKLFSGESVSEARHIEHHPTQQQRQQQQSEKKVLDADVDAQSCIQAIGAQGAQTVRRTKYAGGGHRH